MKYTKHIAFLLAICFLGVTFVNVRPAQAAGDAFQTYVISYLTGEQYVGDFLLADDTVYVEQETVLKMAFIRSTGDGTTTFHLERNGCIAQFTADQVIRQNGGIYLPFIETMEGLCLNTAMPKLGTLMIDAGKSLNELEDLFGDIYLNPELNMSGWQNARFLFVDLYEFDIWKVVMADVVTNMRPVSYLTGSAQREHYEAAFKKLFVPPSEESVDFAKQTLQIGKTLKNYREISDDLGELASITDASAGFLGDYGAVINAFVDVADLFHMDEALDLVAYSKSSKNSEEGLIRGLWQIVKQKNADKSLADAGASVLAGHEAEDEMIWTMAASNIVMDSPQIADKLLAKSIVPQTALVEAANFFYNKLWGTQDQIKGTIMADCYLDIQTLAMECFIDLHKNYKAAAGEDKAKYLQMMHDVTYVYLLCGLHAWNAVALDEDLKSMSEDRISMITPKLEELLAYTPEDIALITYVREIHEVLKECAKADIAEFEVYEGKVEVMPGELDPSVIVTWDQKEVDDVKLDLKVFMQGVMDDGQQTHQELHEGTYYVPSIREDPMTGFVALTIRNTQYWETQLYNHNGVFTFEINCDDDWPMFGGSISEVNPVITLRVPGQEDIELDTDRCMSRSDTGAWYYTFVIDHGQLIYLFE